ncbi:MAG: histidinol-phosphate transaminase [Christensenellales bacterium]
MSRFMQGKYVLFDAYQAGDQPSDRPYIKLNTNESPFPPGPAVLAALAQEDIAGLRLYADPECGALCAALAAHYGLGRDQVLCGNGSDELLDLCFMAWGGQGVAFADMSYGFYQVLADVHGLKATLVPLREDYSLDDRDYLNQHRLIVIANPNAPTGMALQPRQLALIAQSNPDSVVVVDEAYVDYGAGSCVPLVGGYENLLVVHTYSKSRALAGARIGYAMGQAPLIADLRKLKNAISPYNLSGLSQKLGIAALKDGAYYQLQNRAIMATRDSSAVLLRQLGFQVLPSLTNFLFIRHKALGGEAMSLALRRRGFLVRHFPAPRTRDFIRVSIGTREQMADFCKAAGEITAAERR